MRFFKKYELLTEIQQGSIIRLYTHNRQLSFVAKVTKPILIPGQNDPTIITDVISIYIIKNGVISKPECKISKLLLYNKCHCNCNFKIRLATPQETQILNGIQQDKLSSRFN